MFWICGYNHLMMRAPYISFLNYVQLGVQRFQRWHTSLRAETEVEEMKVWRANICPSSWLPPKRSWAGYSGGYKDKHFGNLPEFHSWIGGTQLKVVLKSLSWCKSLTTINCTTMNFCPMPHDAVLLVASHWAIFPALALHLILSNIIS